MPEVSLFAVMSSWSIILVGLPTQIWKNYQMKRRGDNIPPALLLPMFCTYFSWSIHAWQEADYWLFSAQAPGAFLSLILVIQYLYYPAVKEEAQ